MRRIILAFLIASCVCLGACAAGKSSATDAGSPDAGQQASGHTGQATVPGGVKASSRNYKLIGTAGKSTTTSSSPGYQVRRGVVGATQE